MAIDNVARRSVEAILGGTDAQPHDDPKAVLYGNFAQFLPEPNLEPGLKVYRYETFFHLELGVREVLESGLSDRFISTGFEEKHELERSFEARNYALPDTHKLYSFPYRRLKDGIATAANIEIVTLRTLAKIAADGTPLSRSAINNSYRVPFRVALLHMLDLDEISYDSWESPENHGDDKEVFATESYTFHPEYGMKLTSDYSQETPDDNHQVLGPQIGCPATFLRGYIADLHQSIATSALTKGLLRSTS